jgi:AraC-like DNA-binding protein
MEDQKVYLNNNLKVGDIAAELDVPSRMVSDSIKANRSCSFAQFVNGYRIEYAKQLLRNRPDAKMTAVYVESGFSNEMSFFRTFKAFTGMTPKEWMAQKD